MILIVDNNNDTSKAIMTPKITEYFDSKNIEYIIESKISKILEIIKTKKEEITGIILSGSSYCLSNQIDMKDINKNLMVLLRFPEIPILGICFGCQIMTVAYGGSVRRMEKQLIGEQYIQLKKSKLFIDLITPLI